MVDALDELKLQCAEVDRDVWGKLTVCLLPICHQGPHIWSDYDQWYLETYGRLPSNRPRRTRR